jgi:NADPH2:quinone reductase
VHCDAGVADRTVLVAGGAGAVGHYAVQFTKLGGAARVIATVSSAEKAALARAAGADVTLDYRSEDVAARCLELTGGVGVDRVIELDLAANLALDLAAVRKDGELVVYGSGAPEIPVPFFASILKNVRYRFFIVYNLADADRRAAIDGVTRLLAQGRLQHNVAARLPLARIAEAHELVESGRAGGNVVVDLA